MDKLQAGVEFAFAVLPQPSVFLQPREAAFDHPALGHDLKRMQFATLGDLHGDPLAQDVPYAFGKRLSSVAAVTQQALYSRQGRFAALQGLQRTFAVGHLRRCHRNSMGQPLCIDGKMALDPGNLLARVITLLARRITVLHALRVHDQERA
ncbi:hypothetical protein SAMN05216379_11077 [Nitrosomonas eutropha]|nr:hypothetical protein SAMN05216379_11077 [Nitrosomonas eutropha]